MIMEKLDNKPVYNEKHLKTKTKTYEDRINAMF